MQCQVAASELTLAIAIPTSREAFEYQYLQAGRYDYIVSIARRYPGLSQEGLWNLMDPTVSMCNYVAKKAESLGVLVIRDFGSNQFSEALIGSRVISVVGHWRPSPFTFVDIMSPIQLMSEIKGGTDRACEILRYLINAEISRNPEAPLHALLVDSLNKSTRADDADLETDTVEVEADPAHLLRITKAEIEERFPTFIAPGRNVELADGLISVRDFISNIPAGFNGVLDLTICNSTVLGQAIKRCRPEITVVMNRRAASARNRLLIYLAVVREIKRRPQLFGDAVVCVRTAILGILK